MQGNSKTLKDSKLMFIRICLKSILYKSIDLFLKLVDLKNNNIALVVKTNVALNSNTHKIQISYEIVLS